jgi:hypothetical protein
MDGVSAIVLYLYSDAPGSSKGQEPSDPTWVALLEVPLWWLG